jgi:hypothetical protein
MEQTRIPFQMVLDIYHEAAGAPISNAELYKKVADRSGLGTQGFEDMQAPVGKAGKVRNLAARRARWHQQTARHLGLLEKGPRRGTWSAVSRDKKGLTRLHEGKNLLGFSTRLGLAIHGLGWPSGGTAAPCLPASTSRSRVVLQVRHFHWLNPATMEIRVKPTTSISSVDVSSPSFVSWFPEPAWRSTLATIFF